MPCSCDQYQPLELDRKSINRRIKESPNLKKRLDVLAESPDARIKLFHCNFCGQMWQSGREWNFANQEYLFQVPPTSVQEWMREPFMEPAAAMIYSAAMKYFMDRASFDVSDSKCKVENCPHFALRLSVFCKDHHIESLQQLCRLPKKPIGKIFLPYH